MGVLKFKFWFFPKKVTKLMFSGIIKQQFDALESIMQEWLGKLQWDEEDLEVSAVIWAFNFDKNLHRNSISLWEESERLKAGMFDHYPKMSSILLQEVYFSIQDTAYLHRNLLPNQCLCYHDSKYHHTTHAQPTYTWRNYQILHEQPMELWLSKTKGPLHSCCFNKSIELHILSTH